MTPYFETGRGLLFHGDCLDVMRELPDDHVDLTVTSPPYDNLRSYNGVGAEWNFEIFKPIASELFRVTSKNGVVVWVVADATINGSETGNSFRQALHFMECGFSLHDTMIYQKLNYTPLTHNRYEQSFEYMFVFSKGYPKSFNSIKIPCKHPGKIEKYGPSRRRNFGKNHAMRLHNDTKLKATKSTKIAANIFIYKLGQEKTGHPAAFPDQLPADHILSWSDTDDLVFDPFMGSGTVGKQAELSRRKWVGCDKVEKYCEIAAKRIEAAANQKSFEDYL